MKIGPLKIVYFSPTGTTRRIVQAIARGIGGSSEEVIDITNPSDRKRQLESTADEFLIIGVPVYFGRAQANAIEWLSTLKAFGTPAVCIVVYGNREYDDALLELKETLAARGCKPIACAAYIGEHSFSKDHVPIAAGRPDSEDLRHAESFGEKVREKILSTPLASLLADVPVPGKHPYVDMIDSKKRLSSLDLVAVDGSCSQCGHCAQLCPVGAIDPEDSASVDKSKCILCHACIKGCPENARKIKDDLIKNIALRLSETLRIRKEPVFFL